MLSSSTYIHVHTGDEISFAAGAPVCESETGAARVSIDFGGNVGTTLTVFLDVTMAQELARSILATYPLPVAPVEPCRYDAPCSKCVAHQAARVDAARTELARPVPLGAALAADAHRSADLAALRAELTGGPRVLTIVDHTHQCRDCRAEVDCDGDPCVFDGSCDACS